MLLNLKTPGLRKLHRSGDEVDQWRLRAENAPICAPTLARCQYRRWFRTQEAPGLGVISTAYGAPLKDSFIPMTPKRIAQELQDCWATFKSWSENGRLADATILPGVSFRITGRRQRGQNMSYHAIKYF